MGQAMSIESKFCVQVPETLLVNYTVKRTSGQMESGWRIPLECYVERVDIAVPSASRHARSDHKGLENWRIFMDNGPKTPEEYMYGWRRVSTVYPTDLDGDEEAIEKWREATITLLEELEAARIAEGGKTPEDELRELSAKANGAIARMAEADAERVAGYAKEND
jgi:hypothetical protein